MEANPIATEGERAPPVHLALASPHLLLMNAISLFRCVSVLTFLIPRLTVAGEMPPALKPYVDRFDQECAALEALKDAQLKVPRERYHTALAAAGKGAGVAGKTNVIAAVNTELEALGRGELPETFPADLPRQLAPSRDGYLMAVASAARAMPSRQREVAARYLRVLATLETSAAKSMDTEMADAVSNERMRAVALLDAASGKAGRNAVPNGDFTEGDNGSMPAEWRSMSAETPVADATLVTEGMDRFLRFKRSSPQPHADLVLGSQIALPAKAKALSYAVRMRVKGSSISGKAHNLNPGVHFIARDANEQEVCDAWASATQDSSWRKFSGRMQLPPTARSLRIVLGPNGATGTIDFDDVEVEFH